MEKISIIGKTVRAVRVFRSAGVHPAWIDALTLPIVAFEAILEFIDGDFIKISPCEVNLPERYPALGLDFQPCTSESMQFHSHNGNIITATVLEEAIYLMPFIVIGLEESDPLGEDTVNQYILTGDGGQALTFRHIMPPMTLGICVESAARTPSNSFESNPLLGPA